MQICPNNLFRTVCVSFPRSGHHLLVRGMLQYVDKLVYSENYTAAHNIVNCEFVNLQKEHDLELSLPVHDDLKYIVLIREKENAIKAWYKTHLVKNSHVDFETFYKEKSPYYDGFVDKWIIKSAPNTLLIRYEELINNLQESVMRAAEFMGYQYNHEKKTYLDRWAVGENFAKANYR